MRLTSPSQWTVFAPIHPSARTAYANWAARLSPRRHYHLCNCGARSSRLCKSGLWPSPVVSIGSYPCANVDRVLCRREQAHQPGRMRQSNLSQRIPKWMRLRMVGCGEGCGVLKNHWRRGGDELSDSAEAPGRVEFMHRLQDRLALEADAWTSRERKEV